MIRFHSPTGNSPVNKRRKIEALLVLSFASVLAFTGCARAVLTTTLKSDGTWVRHVEYHGAKPGKDGATMGTTINDVFIFPSGPEWKITKVEKDDEVTITAIRAMKPGETIQGDIKIKQGKKEGAVAALNRVSVTQTAPGKFLYSETYHWNGALPKELITPTADEIANIKKILPSEIATDASAKEVSILMSREMWPALFGPGDPMMSNFSQFMTQPEMVVRKLTKRIGKGMEKSLTEKFGSKLTDVQRRDLVRKIVSSFTGSKGDQAKKTTPGGADTNVDSSQPAALTVSIKLPGKILETNGEIDEYSNEVFWSLYPEASAVGDVTLRAACDINQKSVSR